jgi:hypothetical protein
MMAGESSLDGGSIMFATRTNTRPTSGSTEAAARNWVR